ncbi:hypothetical protein C9E89_000045 [Acinetobacter sichuanensis]|uniref:Uncharacterized protein n=1 Tax=Acinetobacter sichuanensis TaxID=2136183 RepID=A0A371YV58_9GAMM|nr:hypothetical protein C9E89_000045 [Acinetobacter sichuanensis]
MIYKIRSSLTNFFGWIAFISTALIILCGSMFSYVGVKIQYALIPTAVISGLIWWLIHPNENNNEN